MNSKIYRQADSRWGSLPYPTKKYSFAGNGCGCCACTHVIIELEKYKNYTPADIRPWMISQGFVTYGNGTTWSGIQKTLEHYGFHVINHATMNDLWETLENRKHRLGVILFRSGSRGGVTWTSGGHYVAFTDYKKVGNKHYLYCKDSGGRHHDEWYCYEDTMRGLIPQIWSADTSEDKYISGDDSPKTYSGKYPVNTISTKTGTKTDVRKWQDFLNWWGSCGLAVDGAFGQYTKSATLKFQKAYGLVEDGIAGPKTIAKAKKVGKTEKH